MGSIGKWRVAVILQWAMLLPTLIYVSGRTGPSRWSATDEPSVAVQPSELAQLRSAQPSHRSRNFPSSDKLRFVAAPGNVSTDPDTRTLGAPVRSNRRDDLLQDNPYHRGSGGRTSPSPPRAVVPKPPEMQPPISARSNTTPGSGTRTQPPRSSVQPTITPQARPESIKQENTTNAPPGPITDSPARREPDLRQPAVSPPANPKRRGNPQTGGDRLLIDNPYHEASPAPRRKDNAPTPVLQQPPQSKPEPTTSAAPSRSSGSQAETDPDPKGLEPDENPGAAAPTPQPVLREPQPRLEQQQAADTDDADEDAEDSLFGDLYDDIEEDKEEKQEKRESRGEAQDSEADTAEKDPHFELFSKHLYPSAKQCAECHEQIFKEWAVSSHAYASVSPMFNKFEQKINGLAQGTVGYFCLRCHAPIATEMAIERDQPIVEQFPAAHEGVTCIVCHRVNERYTRANGERRIEQGSIFNPVYGSSDGSGLHEVLSKKDHYKVKTSPDETGPGQEIHTASLYFDQLSRSEFCVSCHQVAVFPGIKLEVVWEQYRASPACKEGISCQDCHMGKVPGKPLGYATGPSAIVGGKPVNPHRKHSNHMFFGPGYSIAHPGIFPFNRKTDETNWTPSDWLLFDYRAGWGSEQFEKAIEDGHVHVNFPPVWSDAEDRRDAWEIVEENMDTMQLERMARSQLMENSSHIDGPYFAKRPRVGKPLHFHYDVSNLNSGHNAPSGSLGAQPQIWVNAVLVNPHGERVWESGYTDSIGDVADTLSLEVAAGRCKPDLQLVNFQSKFLFTHVKGTDREWYLPVNFDIDQLPFLRPSGFPITTLNHPPFIRMEQRSLPPLATRKARYKVPARAMSVPGKYRLSVRLRSRSHPIYFVRYCEGTPEMERRMNEGMLDFHQDSVEFIVR